jgi:hypothetical protein
MHDLYVSARLTWMSRDPFAPDSVPAEIETCRLATEGKSNMTEEVGTCVEESAAVQPGFRMITRSSPTVCLWFYASAVE